MSKFLGQELDFSDSWDNLMLIVGKIEEDENVIYRREYTQPIPDMYEVTMDAGMGYGVGTTHFEALFNASVDYIEQNNKLNR